MNIMDMGKVIESQLVYTLGVKGNNVWKRVNVGDDVYGETTDCFSQWDYSLGCDIPFCTTVYIHTYIHTYIHLTLRMSVFNWFHRLLRLSHLSGQSWGSVLGCWKVVLPFVKSPKNDGRHFHISVMKDYGVQVSWAKAYNIEFTMIKAMLFFIPTGKTRKPCE